ncbi:hypothetical protein CJ030_MR7G010716 [Morella rubra]|uniref:Uncharacterized protein n=1 Tax=Morella rubra TaxID=262757 RepID=A0A6A1UYD0_9ROSI|nr:hypothetical protein CJ030_MR7G010716 [Morella rubra]
MGFSMVRYDFDEALFWLWEKLPAHMHGGEVREIRPFSGANASCSNLAKSCTVSHRKGQGDTVSLSEFHSMQLTEGVLSTFQQIFVVFGQWP